MNTSLIRTKVSNHVTPSAGLPERGPGGEVHVSLDLWLTLIRSNPAFKPARIRLFRDFFELGQSEDVVTAAFSEHDRLFNAINEKTGRNLSYREMLLILLAHLGKDISGITASRLDEFYAASEAIFRRHPPLWLDAALPGILFSLKEEGHTFSILSNTAFILGRTLRRFVGESPLAGAFSFQLYSDEMEASKPHCRAYEAVFAEVSSLRPIAKAGVLHIGDNPIADGEGAAAFGFQSRLLLPHQNLSELLKSILCTPALQPTP